MRRHVGLTEGNSRNAVRRLEGKRIELAVCAFETEPEAVIRAFSQILQRGKT